ncbi:MAG: energy transducer TonB [Phascolarctobacterium sp.]|nr:energy transducer TonB [Phascolarctobacterium sp.]
MYSANLRMMIAAVASLVCHLVLVAAGQVHTPKRISTDEVYETMAEIRTMDFDEEAVKARIHNKQGYWAFTPLELFILEDDIKVKKIKLEEFDPQTLKKPKIAPIVREPLVKPKLLAHAPVPYPAQAGGQTGRVIVCILVGVNGVPEYVSTASSSGNPFLDGAALEACIKWRFSPAQDADGNDVRCLTYIPVDVK